MRDPADVIDTAVRERLLVDMIERFDAEMPRVSAKAKAALLHILHEEVAKVGGEALAALRDEYGATVAEIEIESPAPDPNTVYVRKVQKRVIPVPVPEGSAS